MSPPPVMPELTFAHPSVYAACIDNNLKEFIKRGKEMVIEDDESPEAEEQKAAKKPKAETLERRMIRTINSYLGRSKACRLQDMKSGVILERQLSFDDDELDMSKYMVIGGDIGDAYKISLSYATGTSGEKKMRLSDKHYGEFSGWNKRERLLEEAKRADAEMYSAFLANSLFDETSVDVKEKLLDFGKGKARSLDFRSSRRRQKFISELVRRILDPKTLDGRKPIFAWGNGKPSKTYRGYRPFPAKELLHALSQRCIVVLIDEFRTSKECSEMVLSSITKPEVDVELLRELCVHDLKFGTYRRPCKYKDCPLNGSSECPQHSCAKNLRRQHSNYGKTLKKNSNQPSGSGITWDRDNNSARLMALRLMYLLKNKGYVPPSLDRGFVVFMRQISQLDERILDDAQSAPTVATSLGLPPTQPVEGSETAVNADAVESLAIATTAAETDVSESQPGRIEDATGIGDVDPQTTMGKADNSDSKSGVQLSTIVLNEDAMEVDGGIDDNARETIGLHHLPTFNFNSLALRRNAPRSAKRQKRTIIEYETEDDEPSEYEDESEPDDSDQENGARKPKRRRGSKPLKRRRQKKSNKKSNRTKASQETSVQQQEDVNGFESARIELARQFVRGLKSGIWLSDVYAKWVDLSDPSIDSGTLGSPDSRQ